MIENKLKIIAMIPARLGSQRLKKKNLSLLNGIPLLTRAIQKCKAAICFDEVWVNTESDELGALAIEENVGFHKRPFKLANNNATSEEFVYQFLKTHECDFLVQVHSIAPLLSVTQIKNFVIALQEKKSDVMLSAIEDQIECAINGEPVNFSFSEKTNSQNLDPIQRITWSITAWKSTSFIETFEKGETATYNGKIDIFEVDKISGHVIKTQNDLDIAEALLLLIK